MEEKNVQYTDFGTYGTEPVDYVMFAVKVGDAVASGECDKGILICGTGIGMSIAANKIKGIRAACCSDEYSAKLTREHNDSNILCFGSRVIDSQQAKKLVDIFLNTEFCGEQRHIRRIEQIKDIENGKFVKF